MTMLLGLDIGSSSIKAALLEAETGRCLAQASSPDTELEIRSPHPGWAEQDPETWWEHAQRAVTALRSQCPIAPESVAAVGISYQMHGLVLLGKDLGPLRPAILWCDSRAIRKGHEAAESLGPDLCRELLLNLPGNFTASKLAWVKAMEPELIERARCFMLPGDYVALRMTGDVRTTASGLSEGTLWNFQTRRPATFLLEYLGLPEALLPTLVPTFGPQGLLCSEAATALGLKAGTPLTYRAGDQPNNAWSLSVLEPGDVAATAGTSGVVYGVTDRVTADPSSRVNTFLHVNDTPEATRLGVLLCLNGCGILQAWTRRLMGYDDYAAMNALAEMAPIGSRGLRIYPFGNGAERILGNLDPGASLHELDFRTHGPSEVCRAVQEGIAFALRFGLETMGGLGLRPARLRAGKANLFLSPVFRQAMASLSGAPVELVETDGAIGAARGAGLGVGLYASPKEAFVGLRTLEYTEPARRDAYEAAYQRWKGELGVVLHEGARP